MYTIDDIQIFIMTHNRANYLKESIESILNQSANVKEIIVLDNESSDNTEEVVQNFSNKGVKYIKTFGFLGNFRKARRLVNKPYCMFFHDDDILHPDYLNHALKILNKHKNISMITTRYTEFYNDNNPKKFKNLKSDYYLFKKQKEFAAHMFFLEHIAFATAIYRTKDLLSQTLDYKKYGKFLDWPLMVKMAKCGNSILLADYSAFFVRIHSMQATRDNTNSLTFEQIVNWDKIFYDILKNDKFLLKMYKHKSEHFLKGKYEAFIPPELKLGFSYSDLLNLAHELGLVDICQNKKSLENSNQEYYKFLTYLNKKDLYQAFYMKVFNFIFQKRINQEKILVKILGIKFTFQRKTKK